MKKSVIIIIALVFVISVALVNFLGVNHKIFDEVISVSEISFSDERIGIDEKTGEKYLVLSPDESGNRIYQIQYVIGPENATDKNVLFAYDSQNGLASIDENGVVTFTRSGTIFVTITPADGSDCSDTLKIKFK